MGQVVVLSWFVSVMGAVNLISGISPALAERLVRLDALLPLAIQENARIISISTGFWLILLAASLRRGKSIAWWLAIVLLLTSAVSHILKGFDFEEALFALVLSLWLIRLRPLFTARSDTPSLRQGIVVLLAALIFSLIYGILGFSLLNKHFAHIFNLPEAFSQTVRALTGLSDPHLRPITGFGHWFADSISTIGVITGSYGLLLLLRPVVLRRRINPTESNRAQSIVTNYGRTALAPLAMLPDKHYFFSAGRSRIAYGVADRMAISLGDPIGPTSDRAKAIQTFRDFCRSRDWETIFYQATPELLNDYQRAGFSSLLIGHEAIVRLADFQPELSPFKPLRAPINRLERLGYRWQLVRPPVPAYQFRQLESINASWLAQRGRREWRFSLGWFDKTYLSTTPLALVFDPVGQAIAFANLLAVGRDSLAIDLMRHRQPTENGLMDFLFTNLLLWAKQEGYHTVSLGLSPLAGVGGQPTDSIPERLLHLVYRRLNQIHHWQGLRNFKEKFVPIWLPRSVVFEGSISRIPQMLMALVKLTNPK